MPKKTNMDLEKKLEFFQKNSKTALLNCEGDTYRVLSTDDLKGIVESTSIIQFIPNVTDEASKFLFGKKINSFIECAKNINRIACRHNVIKQTKTEPNLKLNGKIYYINHEKSFIQISTNKGIAGMFRIDYYLVKIEGYDMPFITFQIDLLGGI